MDELPFLFVGLLEEGDDELIFARLGGGGVRWGGEGGGRGGYQGGGGYISISIIHIYLQGVWERAKGQKNSLFNTAILK